MFRRSLLMPLGVLFLGLIIIPACRKKGTDGTSAPEPATSDAPGVVQSDHLLFVQLNVKHIRESAIFTEVKRAVAKAGGSAEWEQAEEGFSRETGIKPSDINTFTMCVLEAPLNDKPKYALILAANNPISKVGAFGLKPDAKPDARGFYRVEDEAVAHFPDDKTLVVLPKELTQKYLDGYAKDRTGWPLTANLSKAAAGHTLFVSAQLDKMPAEIKNEREFQEFAPLLAAKSLTATANLRGKELSLAARATFADAASATRAKAKGHELINVATAEVERFTKSKDASDLGAVLPAVKEAGRALGAVKLDTTGSDLTLAGDYKADFDFGTMIAEGVIKVREAAARLKATNNLKQIGSAMWAHHDRNNRFLIHGIGAKGAPLTKPTDKLLLSWRVALLPYLEQEALYRQFKLDEPWDSESNKKLIAKMPAIYAPINKPGKPGYTHLQMVIGPKAMHPAVSNVQSITDGTSNTIAVIEAVDPVIWTKPDDVMVPGKELPKDLKKKFGGQSKGGFNALLWDGSARFISDAISDKTLGALLSPAGGEVPGSDW